MNDVKARKGILCTLSREPNGRVRLELDDVAMAIEDGMPTRWKVGATFTSTSYPERDVLDVTLPEDALADIGLNIVSRLVALGCEDSGGHDPDLE